MATIVMVAVGRGPGIVLALLLVVVLASVAGALTVVLATAATWLRWHSTSLGAIGGAQAVLGPAMVVGPPAAAAAVCLAALGLVVSGPGNSVPGALAVGATAAFLAAGPAGADGIAIRVAAAAAGALLAVVIARLLRARVRAGLGVVLAVGATVFALLA